MMKTETDDTTAPRTPSHDCSQCDASFSTASALIGHVQSAHQ